MSDAPKPPAKTNLWAHPAQMQAAYFFFHNKPPPVPATFVLQVDPAVPAGQPGHMRLVQQQDV